MISDHYRFPWFPVVPSGSGNRWGDRRGALVPGWFPPPFRGGSRNLGTTEPGAVPGVDLGQVVPDLGEAGTAVRR